MTALEQLFLDVVNLSLTASWVIAIVLLLRLALKPVPKKYVCLLWFVVLFRLLCPVSLESEFSLVPPHEEVKYEIVYTTPQVETNSEPVNTVLNQTVNPVLEQNSAPNPMGSVNPLQVYIFIAAWLWVIGIAVLCGYTLISWVWLRHQLAESIPDEGNVYVSDAITSPFVFGIVNPKIYLPYGLEDDERRWVLLHEQSHIARKDYLVKPLFWLAVILHWMNPLVWIAWFCFSRDLELACDERATAAMNKNEKWSYSNTLLNLAVEKRSIKCPVAFSNNGVRQRIERILKYKQLPKVIIGVVLIALMICGVGLLMNPTEVYTLAEFEPKLVKEYPEGISNIKIQYGAIEAPVYSGYDEAETRMEFRNQLANLKVTKAKETEFPFTNTMISFMGVLEYGYDSERDMMYGSSEGCELVISDDFTTIFAKDTLKVKNPDALKELLLPYCNEAKTRYQQTTFYADLNHDGTDETIILNKGNWSSMDEVRLGVYQDDGTLLYSDSLYAAHVGWKTYFLYEKDGKDYLLEFNPTMYQGNAAYSWYMMDFDRSGKLRIVDEDRVEFSVNPEQFYEFDVDAIYAFLQETENMLNDATLLVSVEDGELLYSTAQKTHWLGVFYYLDWLDEAKGDTLEQKLYAYQQKVYYERPEYLLRQWLMEKQGFDETAHYLDNPKLIDIDGDQSVSYEWKQKSDNEVTGIYAISAMNSDDYMDVKEGRNYYIYAGERWKLLENSVEMDRIHEMVDAWAEAYANRDGQKRYDMLKREYQLQIDNRGSTYELWMPYWSEDKQVLDLRGSSPWVESWTINTNEDPENYLAVITYDMADSAKQHYIYQEQIKIQQINDTLKVTSCDVTISNLTSEQCWKAVNIVADLQNGRETWRLDPEQVAFAFLSDYLNISPEEIVEDDRTQTGGRYSPGYNRVTYMMKNGDTYTVQLYQPLIQTDVSDCDFWAVESYTYNEWGGDGFQSFKPYHYDVRHDAWASLHIRE